MHKANLSNIKIRDDVDQKLAHKYDSPNEKKQNKKQKIRHCELGYYVVDDGEQSNIDNSEQHNIDSSNTRVLFENNNGEYVEIKQVRMKSEPISWEQYEEANK